MFCVIFIFARITHVKVCSVKYSCPLVFSYKNEEGEEEGRNPVKFGCVVGGGRLRRRSRSREEEDFDKVEMEQGDQKETKRKEKKTTKKNTREPLASPSFPRCIQ